MYSHYQLLSHFSAAQSSSQTRIQITSFYCTFGCPIIFTDTYSHYQLLSHFRLPNHLHRHIFTLLAFMALSAAQSSTQSSTQTRIHITSFYRTFVCPIICTVTYSHYLLLSHFRLPNHLHRHVFILLAFMALSYAQSSAQSHIHITCFYRTFGCPIIYTDTYSHYQLLSHFRLPNHLHRHVFTLLAFMALSAAQSSVTDTYSHYQLLPHIWLPNHLHRHIFTLVAFITLSAAQSSVQTRLHITCFYRTFGCPIIYTDTYSHYQLLWHFWLPNHLHRHVFTLLAFIALSAAQSFVQTRIHMTSFYRTFGCLIIYTDTYSHYQLLSHFRLPNHLSQTRIQITSFYCTFGCPIIFTDTSSHYLLLSHFRLPNHLTQTRIQITSFYCTFGCPIIFTDTYSHYQLLSHFRLPNHLHRHVFTLLAFMAQFRLPNHLHRHVFTLLAFIALLAAQLSAQTRIHITSFYHTFGCPIICTDTYSHYQLLSHFRLPNHLHRHVFTLLAFMALSAAQSSAQTCIHITSFYRTFVCPIICTVTYSHYLLLSHFRLPNHLHRHVFTLLAFMALSAAQSSAQTCIHITSFYRTFGCPIIYPIIYTDTSSHYLLLWHFRLPNHLHRHVFTFLAFIALLAAQSSTQSHIHISSFYRTFGCPFIYTDTYSHFQLLSHFWLPYHLHRHIFILLAFITLLAAQSSTHTRIHITNFYHTFGCPIICTDTYSHYQLLPHFWLPNHLHRHIFTLLAFITLLAGQSSVQTRIHITSFYHTLGCPIIYTDTYSHYQLLSHFWLPNHLHRHIFTLLAFITLLAAQSSTQSSTQTRIHISSFYHTFGCPIIYTDTYSHFQLLSHFWLPNHLHSHIFTLLAFITLLAAQSSTQTYIHITGFYHTFGCPIIYPIIYTDTYSHFQLLSHFWLPNHLHRHVFTFLAFIALLAAQSSTQSHIHISSFYRTFGCPFIYTDTYSHFQLLSHFWLPYHLHRHIFILLAFITLLAAQSSTHTRIHITNFYHTFGCPIICTDTYSHYQLLPHFWLPNHLHRHIFTLLAFITLLAGQSSVQTRIHITSFYHTLGCPIIYTDTYSHHQLLPHFRLPNHLHRHIFTLLAFITLSAVQSSAQTHIHITSFYHTFVCPIICIDTYSHYQLLSHFRLPNHLHRHVFTLLAFITLLAAQFLHRHVHITSFYHLSTSTQYSHYQLLSHFRLPNHLHRHIFTLLAFITLSAAQLPTQTHIHITSFYRTFGCPIICTDTYSHYQLLSHFRLPNYLHRHVFTLLAFITLLAAQLSAQTRIHITSFYHTFGCPIICTDTYSHYQLLSH